MIRWLEDKSSWWYVLLAVYACAVVLRLAVGG